MASAWTVRPGEGLVWLAANRPRMTCGAAASSQDYAPHRGIVPSPRQPTAAPCLVHALVRHQRRAFQRWGSRRSCMMARIRVASGSGT